MNTSDLLIVLDLVGIAVFAASGALTGVEKRLDIFGVVVLAATTAIGGGLVRDAVLGATPAIALTDWRYLVTPAVIGLLVFFVHPTVNKMSRLLLVVDAAGLGLFAVAGTRKAIDFGVGPVGACGVGVLTAVGGGILRDVLVREIPVVLHREIYATAALVATLFVVIADRQGWNDTTSALVGAGIAFVIRVISRWKRWSAPTPKTTPT